MQWHHRINYRILSSLLVLSGCMLTMLGCTNVPGAHQEKCTLRVAVAANLRFAFEELRSEFHKAHPAIYLEPSYGSSGNFVSQITNGAPFDIFLSADTEYIEQLIKLGAVDPKSVFHYAVGQMVLWVPKDSPLDLESQGLAVLLDATVRRIAIANPQHAPYGRAAQAALTQAGHWHAVRERLLFAENISQAAQYVESGAAEVGLLAQALALAPSLQQKGRFWVIPASMYPHLTQAGAILRGGKHPAEAQLFQSFVMGPTGQTILRRFGYLAPQE